MDWLVEIQENFELNHETLYLAVKLTDVYLSRVPVGKDVLQLVGATSVFIASKFDVRSFDHIHLIICISFACFLTQQKMYYHTSG